MLKDEADLVNGEIWYRGRRAGFISDTKLNFTWTANNVQTEIVLEKNRDGSLALQRTEIYLQSRDITVLSSAALEPMP